MNDLLAVAEQQLRRIIGYRDLATLVIAIERHTLLVAEKNRDQKEIGSGQCGESTPGQGDLYAVHGAAGTHVARDPWVECVDGRVLGLELGPASLRR